MRVAGVDEVGVGALAGPVVAAAVIIAPGLSIKGLADSKLLTAKRRVAFYVVIRECAISIEIGRTEVEDVHRMNVYWAAMEARRRAVEALPVLPRHVPVDGRASHRRMRCFADGGDRRGFSLRLDRGGIHHGQGDARFTHARIRMGSPGIRL